MLAKLKNQRGFSAIVLILVIVAILVAILGLVLFGAAKIFNASQSFINGNTITQKTPGMLTYQGKLAFGLYTIEYPQSFYLDPQQETINDQTGETAQLIADSKQTIDQYLASPSASVSKEHILIMIKMPPPAFKGNNQDWANYISNLYKPISNLNQPLPSPEANANFTVQKVNPNDNSPLAPLKMKVVNNNVEYYSIGIIGSATIFSAQPADSNYISQFEQIVNSYKSSNP